MNTFHIEILYEFISFRNNSEWIKIEKILYVDQCFRSNNPVYDNNTCRKQYRRTMSNVRIFMAPLSTATNHSFFTKTNVDIVEEYISISISLHFIV